MAEHHKTCAHCGNLMEGRRSDARWCSQKCYRASNPICLEKRKEYHSRYYEKNREACKEASRRCKSNKRDDYNAKRRRWYLENIDRERERSRIKMSKFRAANPEKVRDWKRRWHNDMAASSAHMHALGIITVKGGKLGNDQPE